MHRSPITLLSLAAALACGCAGDSRVSARFGDLSLCNDVEGGLDPDCEGLLEVATGQTSLDLPHPDSTGGPGSTSAADATDGSSGATSGGPTPPDQTAGTYGTTYVDPTVDPSTTYFDPTVVTYGTTYVDPTVDPTVSTYGTTSVDPTYGTTYVDPTQADPTAGTYGTTYVDPTQADPTAGTYGTTYVDPTQADPTAGTTQADPTAGTYGATSGGTTSLTEPGGTTTGDTGEDSGTDTDTDATTEAPPNTCSAQCPFAQGEGLAANVPAGPKLPFVQGCAENGAPGFASTSAIVACLTNVACHLGRNPSKAEALEALGIGRKNSMLGEIALYSTSSASAQAIPKALSDKPEGIRAVRAISAPFFEGAPWCSFTSLADDNSFECMNVGFFVNPRQTCGTEPVGIKFDALCEQLDATTTEPASAAVFKNLAEAAIDDGDESCSLCHGKMDDLKAQNGKQCFFFPIDGPLALCPLKPLAATCATEGDVATCADKSVPQCPTKTQIEGATPTCTDGKVATCPGPVNAVCTVDPGVYGEVQTGISGFTTDVCNKMAQIAKNAQKQIDQGPSLPWTDTTFVDAYIAAFCKKP